VNRADRRDYAVRARIVVLAASACETARLMLNSTRPVPDGVANSSGVVGRHLTDSTGSPTRGIPKMSTACRTTKTRRRGGTLHAVVVDNAALDFPRGYYIELGGGRRFASFAHGRDPALQRRRRLRQDARAITAASTAPR
jgi:choline dehydrogenase-like flavoprotein